MIRRAAGTAVVVVLALAGCTGGEPPADDALPLGAIDRFWDDLRAGNEYGDAVAQHNRMQEDIAACMNAQGFEYTPIESQVEVVTAVDLDLERGTREYAEEFGYGIATDDMGYYALTAETADDPNARYVAGLSEAARAEYQNALHGEASSDAGEFPSWDQRGCTGYAENRAYLLVQATETMDPDALWQEEERMRDAVLLDDRLVALHRDWSDCMADAGHPGLTVPWDGDRRGDGPGAIRAEFEERYLELQLEQPPSDTPAAAQTGIAALRVKSELGPREIAMAVADVDCRASTGYDEVLREVQVEHQADYWEAHRIEYEAYAAAYAELLAARG